MGSGGPGNITHIDNLYVKPQAVKTNTNILLGDYVIYDTDGLRTIIPGDFSADDSFLDIKATPVFQAAESANNLTTTLEVNRKTSITVINIGADWINKMDAGVLPQKSVGIKRLDSHTPVFYASDVANSVGPTFNENLGRYQHKEFATEAAISVDNDDGTVHTGVA